MVETITPVVYGGRTRWAVALALHTIGALATAAVFGATLGLLGAALGAPWGRAGGAAVAVVAGIYLLGELPGWKGWRPPVPQMRRQVPAWWREYFGWAFASFLYGAGLGIGFFTFLRNGTLVAVAAGALASGRPMLGALVMAPFGLARGLSAGMSARVDSPEASRRLVERLVSAPERRRGVVNAALLVIVALLALVTALRGTDGWETLAPAVLALVFGWAAISKMGTGWHRWRRTLARHGLPGWLQRVAAPGVPLAEVTVPLLVLVGLPRVAGLWTLAIVVTFSMEVLRVRLLQGSDVPCGCFGGRSSVPVTTLLLRNAALIAVAAFVVATGADTSVVHWPGAPTGAGRLPAGVAMITLVVAGWTLWRVMTWLGRGKRA
jgi:hypothetical protein